MNLGDNNGGHKKLPAQPSKSGKVQLKIGYTPSERGPIRLVKFDEIKAAEKKQEIIDLSEEDDCDNNSNNSISEASIIKNELESHHHHNENEYVVRILNDFTTSMDNELYQVVSKIPYIKKNNGHSFSFNSIKEAFQFYDVMNMTSIEEEPLVVLYPVEKCLMPF